MPIPSIVIERLAGTVHERGAQQNVADVLRPLGVRPPVVFQRFFARFIGPFRSKRTGFELLDTIDGYENIVTSTLVCRAEHGFPEPMLVECRIYN